ncbi:GDSL-type esterase/lipase family protein [Butyrivibrio sp. FC2001]|uniref:GDSL-type esterase/lipase family protein n=1 Tax=Butyrivibrio sp. FC2001 TaxID=1280671 RepID=UPI0003F81B4F|nr:GDSL-type esterase/lipase family protein [Butyrivibrio sp. FC2001]
MKTFFQHILSMGILVVALLLTVDSALGQKSAYEEIEYDSLDAPIMSLTLRHVMEGGQPYLIELLRKNIFGAGEEATDISEGENEVITPENEPAGEPENVEQPDATQPNEEVSDGNSDEVSSGDAFGEVSDGNAEVSGGDSAETFEEAVSDGVAAEPEPENDNYVMTAVPDTYFDDALFIGDSRTVGLSEYCEELKGHATFYAKVSLTIYGFNKKEFVVVPIRTEEGVEVPEDQLPKEKVTIEEALTRKQFAKIYIMLGLNELGSGTAESFTNSYGEVVNRIRELQPDAIIIIQGIMHVTHSKSSNDRVFKNSTINDRNAMLQTLADGEHVFYVDMNEATDDENGALGHDLSFDNVHLKAKSYSLWYDYLKNHAFVKEKDLEQTQQLLQQEIDSRAAENPENPE